MPTKVMTKDEAMQKLTLISCKLQLSKMLLRSSDRLAGVSSDFEIHIETIRREAENLMVGYVIAICTNSRKGVKEDESSNAGKEGPAETV